MTDPTDAPTPRRPIIVTVAIVLIYLTALSSVATGIIVLLSRYQVPDDDVLSVSLVGAATILLGLLTIALASGLSRGSRFARLLVTIYLVIDVVLHVLAIATSEAWDWSPLVQAILNSAIVVVLWAPPGSRWFTATQPVVVTA
ncbi:hypothetical protein ACFQZV_05190 [Microbacterium koreense]|uniref:Uncharacterized protein n=1 Tax=Microbacterium koreense TaxID=323761 RepID=A0ABW2ZPX5_9MICO